MGYTGKDLTKTTISGKFDFDAAHHLPWHTGKCQNIHGHTYTLIVTVEGAPNKNGVVMDFGELKRIVNKRVIERLDHKDLNEYFENPTAELMAQDIFRWISNSLPMKVTLSSIRLYESPNTWVEVRGC